MHFSIEDVTNINAGEHGEFDAIICSGILYHLHENDIPWFMENIFEMTGKVLVIDAKVSLQPESSFEYLGRKFWGKGYHEHDSDSTQEEKSSNPLASWDNATSFWLTRPSLVNLVGAGDFTSAYENLLPAHINFGFPGPVPRDRCTSVAIKSPETRILTSPTVNRLHEMRPETSPRYSPADR